MGKVLRLAKDADRAKALRKARLIFTAHSLQTLGMFTLPWLVPWWISVAIFVFIAWLNHRHRGCPVTHKEYRLRRMAGYRGRGHSVVGRLFMAPMNLWRPETKRVYPSKDQVNFNLLVSPVLIFFTSLLANGHYPETWYGIILRPIADWVLGLFGG